MMTMLMKEAKLTHDTEFFKKMDPYVEVTYLNQSFKTPILHNCGKNPKWEESFIVDVKDENALVSIDVFDYETGTTDNLIGSRKLKMSNLTENGGVNKWFIIRYDNSVGGEIHIKTSFKLSKQQALK